MSTNYREVREADRCPILFRCVRQLKKMVSALEFDGESEEVYSLGMALAAAPTDPDYVRLRGFIAIEAMLTMLQHVYTRCYNEHGPKLEARTWNALTNTKREVEKILDRSSLDITELELAGVQLTTNDTVILTRNAQSCNLTEITSHATVVHRVHSLSFNIDHAITALRPFLRNEEAGVGVIADDLATCYREVYGVVATSPFLEKVQEMMGVRL
jgi:hypothetical protein